MAREAAYWIEFQPKIQEGMAREIPEWEVIEVLQPIQIAICWKEKTRGGWQEYLGFAVYNPGEVLHREWRIASQWEIEKWQALSEEKLKELSVFKKNGEFSVQIVEKIVDLPAAIRQKGRHVPARKIARMREKFVLAGSSQILAGYASRLSALLQDFLRTQKPDAQLMERASTDLIQVSQLLEGSRTSFKKRAAAEIQLILQGEFWEIPAKTSQAITELLNQRAKDYEIAAKSITLAEIWRDLMADIERRFRNCYNRLGQLGERLQKLLSDGKEISAKELLSIANEAQGIYLHLIREVPNFNPYYQRLQTPEFQRLSRVAEHGREGRAETVFNDIEEAMAKLEAVAIGEKPTRAELRKGKVVLF